MTSPPPTRATPPTRPNASPRHSPRCPCTTKPCCGPSISTGRRWKKSRPLAGIRQRPLNRCSLAPGKPSATLTRRPMTDFNDELEELLAPQAARETPELRDAILRQTERRLVTRKWLRRAGKAVAVAAVFPVGVGVGV